MNRPYFPKSTAELEQLYLANCDDRRTLEALIVELKHRNTQSAAVLRNKIDARLAFISSKKTKDTGSKSSRKTEWEADDTLAALLQAKIEKADRELEVLRSAAAGHAVEREKIENENRTLRTQLSLAKERLKYMENISSQCRGQSDSCINLELSFLKYTSKEARKSLQSLLRKVLHPDIAKDVDWKTANERFYHVEKLFDALNKMEGK